MWWRRKYGTQIFAWTRKAADSEKLALQFSILDMEQFFLLIFPCMSGWLWEKWPSVVSGGECRGPFLFCVSGKGLICSPFLTVNLRDKLESEEKNDFKQSKLSKWGSTASAWVSPNIFINNAEISSFERKTLQPAVSTVSSFFNSSAGIKIHKKEVANIKYQSHIVTGKTILLELPPRLHGGQAVEEVLSIKLYRCNQPTIIRSEYFTSKSYSVEQYVVLCRDGPDSAWGFRLKGGSDVDGGSPLEVVRVSWNIK